MEWMVGLSTMTFPSQQLCPQPPVPSMQPAYPTSAVAFAAASSEWTRIFRSISVRQGVAARTRLASRLRRPPGAVAGDPQGAQGVR
jgi:hypothetical protein